MRTESRIYRIRPKKCKFPWKMQKTSFKFMVRNSLNMEGRKSYNTESCWNSLFNHIYVYILFFSSTIKSIFNRFGLQKLIFLGITLKERFTHLPIIVWLQFWVKDKDLNTSLSLSPSLPPNQCQVSNGDRYLHISLEKGF